MGTLPVYFRQFSPPELPTIIPCEPLTGTSLSTRRRSPLRLSSSHILRTRGFCAAARHAPYVVQFTLSEHSLGHRADVQYPYTVR